MSRQQRRANWAAVLIGLAATGAVVAAYVTGTLDWLEHKTLDLRFRYANSIEERDDLVRIDIDDRSLKLFGRWPWPRHRQAPLIAIPHELGAKAILVDLEWLEHETSNWESGRYADMLPGTEGELHDSDAELQQALSAAGNTYLAFHYRDDESSEPRNANLEIRRRIDEARGFIREALAANAELAKLPPSELFPALFESFSSKPFENDSAEKQALYLALVNVLNSDATLHPNFDSAGLRDAARPVDEFVPAYFRHARAARRCGFVVVEADADGVVRRLPLLARHDETIMPQLALGLACDMLGVAPGDIAVESGALVFAGRRVQFDERGRTIVPWVSAKRYKANQNRHIPAAKIMEVDDWRRQVEQNAEGVRIGLWALLAPSSLDEREDFRKLIEDYENLRAQTREFRGRGNEAALEAIRALLRQLEAEIDVVAGRIIDRLRSDPGPLAERKYPKEDGSATSFAEAFSLVNQQRDANARLRLDIEHALDELRPRLNGKICLIGYTATSLADMAPIPTARRAAGVLAHYYLLNGLLSNQLVHWASTGVNVLLTIGLGAVATLLSVFRRPREVIFGVLLASVLFVLLAGYWAFYQWTFWIALTPPIAAMLLSYVAIASFRYIFVDRERRQLSTALGQYTSKEIARQVAENTELCRRAETREVTSIFTDLKGFTTISEEIGAERTQRVLNACLGRFTEIMLRHEAMVNKFMGDGIFAFWNPVIYPQDDHAALACETAIDLGTGLIELIEEQRRAGGDPVFQQLVLRIGIASGNAVVGPCGSEQKYDYTCIGDSVNLAARLEPANKFFGTFTLVSGTTRDEAGERFVYRWLGRVQVVGKHAGVPVYELLGREGQVEASLLEYAEQFGDFVGKFGERKWSEARRALEKCLQRRPDDLAARRYAEALAAWEKNPPGDGWNGAIELTHK